MRIALTIILASFLAAELTAQDQRFRPSKELKRMDRLIGVWKGSGILKDAPDGEVKTWSSVAWNRWILNEHFVQRDSATDFSEEGIEPLERRLITGWNHRAGRFTQYTMDSRGGARHGELFWIDDDTVVFNTSSVVDGTPVNERHTTRLTESGYSIKIEWAMGTGNYFTHAEGSFREVKSAGEKATIVERVAFERRELERSTRIAETEEVTREMRYLRSFFGDWDLNGTIRRPNVPTMSVSGRQVVGPMWAGRALITHVRSDPDPLDFVYEIYGFMMWNERNQCYDHFWVNNTGDSEASEGRWEDDATLVFAGAVIAPKGKAEVVRSVLKIKEDGTLATMAEDRMTSTGDAARVFEATYTRIRRVARGGGRSVGPNARKAGAPR